MQTLKNWIAERPFTLALSSSFFGFYAHCGVVKALYESGIRPAKITGSSSGSLVGAGLASGLTPDEIYDILFSLERSDFWDPGLGFGLLRGRKFQDRLKRHVAHSFAETKIPIELAVLDIFSMKTRFIGEGDLPAAVVASCAVPLMFQPVRIGSRLFLDGGVFHKSAIQFEKKDERIFNIYLQAEGWMSAYEGKTNFKKLAPNHKVLRYLGLPKVDFYNLKGRDESYKAAYERTLVALSKAVDASLIHEA